MSEKQKGKGRPVGSKNKSPEMRRVIRAVLNDPTASQCTLEELTEKINRQLIARELPTVSVSLVNADMHKENLVIRSLGEKSRRRRNFGRKKGPRNA